MGAGSNEGGAAEAAMGVGPSAGGAIEAAVGVGPNGKALCLGSALFRANTLSTIFTYLTSHRKISLEQSCLTNH